MEIIAQTTEFHIPEKTAVAIGKFDGIHLGHKRLISELELARRLGLKTAVFTFDPSPSVFFQGSGEGELMTNREKRLQFAQMGIDYLVEYPFRAETAAVTAEDYVNRFLLSQMNAAFIAAGEDVRYGHKGLGDAALLKRLAAEREVQVRIIPKLCHNGREISSTYVREAVLAGDMELAAKLLERPFYFSGRVERGRQIGRTIGMPTVNLIPEEGKITPPFGVYYSTIAYGHQTFYGVTNVGCKPTVTEERKVGVETYVFDFSEDIYGKDITVYLHHFARPEQKFDGLDALKDAIGKDVMGAREYFQNNSLAQL